MTSAREEWRNALLPCLNSIRIVADGAPWSGFDPLEARNDLNCEEGPISIRSASWENGSVYRRTLAFCSEYALDIAALSGDSVRAMEWRLDASLIRSIEPPALPRPGAPLPLEARWIVKWRAESGVLVKSSGESARGTVAEWTRKSDPHAERWSVERRGTAEFFAVCHEPAEKPKVRATFTLLRDHRYSVRVTGDGFFDYWMLDPAHTPAPLKIDAEEVVIGKGWGFVRLESGKEASYGALRRDWGLT